jgi:uncharacterized 2Fe-2S/4Fe-4S cluster protein (DUF4445 family)
MKNKTILQYLQEKHIIVDGLCNGQKQCRRCKVKVLNRDLEPNIKEKTFLSEKELNEGIRLACFHQYCRDDQIITMSQQMQIEDRLDIINEVGKYQGIGVIIDIGTTTIVMKWIDRSCGECKKTVSFINPQVSFGGDVMSRIHYQNKTQTTYLHDILVASIEQELIKENIEINQMIICGNTTMIHFFLGEDVSSLGQAPFHVYRKEMCRISSQNIFKKYKYECEIITFPHISAFVGGDIVAGILALNMDISDQNILLLDLGTNGEIVVGNKNSFIVTATAAGPAFEGVGMSCGGGSVSGAIDYVHLDPLYIHTINDAKAKCICGSGYVSLISQLVEKKLISSMGKIKDGKEIRLTNDIYINQNDISQFQLAKAAIQTGIEVLLKDTNVDYIYIAGGFGSHLKIDDFKRIKVVPKDIENIETMGNSAIKGCYQLLMSQDFERVNQIVAKSKAINLAEYEDFEDCLIESLYFYDEDYIL